MPAVIAPVSVNYAQLCHSWVALFGIPEIAAAEQQVVEAHGKTHLPIVIPQTGIVPRNKTADPCHIGRRLRFYIERLGLFQRSQAAFNRIDQISFDLS